jgi:hypothetical protein
MVSKSDLITELYLVGFTAPHRASARGGTVIAPRWGVFRFEEIQPTEVTE